MRKMKGFSLYMHIPYCIKKCPYCDFNSYAIGENPVPDTYVRSLIRELKIKQKRFRIKDSLKSIYFGGGTPSLLSVEQVKRLLKTALSIYGIKNPSKLEITIEVNPASASIEKLKGFKDAGVNRFIIGVQSFCNSDLKKLGRIHGKKEAVILLNDIKKLKFRNFGIDLIFGIPGQSLKNWLHNLKLAVSLKPKHISAYNLTLEKRVPMTSLIKKRKWAMPGERLEEKMFMEGGSFLKNSGFLHYEISNYAKRGFESVHNKNYWERHTYIGLGAGAHSFIKKNKLRMWNIKHPDEYIKKLGRNELPVLDLEKLKSKEEILEKLMLSLRTEEGIAKNKLNYLRKTGFNKLINKYKTLGYIREKTGSISLTEKGFFLSDEIIRSLASLL